MGLIVAIKKFTDMFARSPHCTGRLDISASPLPLNTTLPISNELETYFKSIEFEGKPHVGGFFHLILFSPERLIAALYGWRWITSKSGQIEEDTAYWQPSWVIFAEHNGDPLYVDCESNEVFSVIEAETLKISESLTSFLSALADIMSIEMDKYGFDVEDADHDPYPTFVQDVKTVLAANLSIDAQRGFEELFFG